ncbi:Uu.00g011620.m01.CDS01 [Anthostomella pinea]|uniref:Uu.00g011620.m01.CDS01 n=1 Tax=Anthostomella pinea TaxID=933095 RepID=A0AAI8VXS8_9PEZI|nr:Uu.00g011620.m01.CDS01 [Anthostomella pinea]
MHFASLLVAIGLASTGRALSVGMPGIGSRDAHHARSPAREVNLPQIGHGFTRGTTKYQKLLAASDASIWLLNSVVVGFDNHEKIFLKYWDKDWKDNGRKIWERLAGNDKAGAPQFKEIKLIYDGAHEAVEFDGYEVELGRSAMKLPSVHNVMGARQANGQNICHDLRENGIGFALHELLEGIIIEGYLQLPELLDDITPQKMTGHENFRSPYQAQQLDKKEARYTAESYVWYAVEVFWADFCNKNDGFEASLEDTT